MRTPARPPSRQSLLPVAALALPAFMASLDTSIANAALPSLAQALYATPDSVRWVVLSYLLAVTTLIVTLGKLGDLLGQRRLLSAGIWLFVAGSIGCGLASSLFALVVSRLIQGAGAAAKMSMTLASIDRAVTPERRGAALGLVGTMSALGTALGPTLGGILTSALGWRSIFLVNVPIGALALVGTMVVLSGDSRDMSVGPRRLNVMGTLMLALTIGAYAMAFTLDSGHKRWLPAACLAGSVLFGALFVWTERRASIPLIQADTLRNQVLRTGLVKVLIVSAVLMSTIVVGPFYLTSGLRISPAQAGFVLSVGPLIVVLTGTPAGLLADRIGPAKASNIGLSVIALGCLSLASLQTGAGITGYLASIAMVTAGYAVFQTANNLAVLGSVGPNDRGVASGLVNLARNLGLITGASALGTVYTHFSGIPGALMDPTHGPNLGLRATFAVASALIGLALVLSLRGNRPWGATLRESRIQQSA